MLYSRKLISLLLLGLLFSSPFYALAQSAPTSPVPAPTPQGLSSCFDYYHFGSVYATVSSSLAKVSSGGAITFSGTVTNNNTYAVSDVSVYAKVLQNRSQKMDIHGPDVVAWIPVASGMSLQASESKQLAYTWQVPADMESGDYKFATYVVVDNRFNMSGLTFTDDVVGNSANFSVLGQDTGAVRFDKSTVKVDNRDFSFAAFPPTISNTESQAVISSGVSNTTTQPYDGTVTWNLYSWDGLRSETLLDTATEELKVHPNASTTISYTAPLSVPASVYFVTAEFKTKEGATSFINVRFVKNGVNIPRLNAVGVDNGVAFACIHSMGTADASGGEVDISVQRTDLFGSLLSLVGLGTLAHATYAGTIPGSIYALATPLKGTSSSYEVTAKLYQNKKLLDTVTIPYGNNASRTAYIVLTILAAVIAVALILLLIRRP